MTKASIGEIEEMFADLLLAEGFSPQNAIFAMVEAFPDATAMEYLLVACTVATIVEAEAAKKTSIPLPSHTEIYKLAAILALDLMILEGSCKSNPTGHKLILHWESNGEILFCRGVKKPTLAKTPNGTHWR